MVLAPQHDSAPEYSMTGLFKEVMVWRRLDAVSAIRYACFQDLGNDKFAVQSADFFRLPLTDVPVHDLATQFAELFIETSPADRCSWFDSLGDAIANHDLEFCQHKSGAEKGYTATRS